MNETINKEYVLLYYNPQNPSLEGYLGNNDLLTENADEAKKFNSRPEAIMYNNDNKDKIGDRFYPSLYVKTESVEKEKLPIQPT